MARVKIKFPAEKPLFKTAVPLRISDINYGGHMGNDAVLSIVHEARLQWLSAHGYTELNAGGAALIMADAMIAFRAEGFYGDVLHIHLYAEEITTTAFDLLYRIFTHRDGQEKDIAHIKTGMLCFDYEARKIATMPPALTALLSVLE